MNSQFVSVADPEIPEATPLVHQPFQQPIQVMMQPEGQPIVIQQPINQYQQPNPGSNGEQQPLQRIIIVEPNKQVTIQQQPRSPAHLQSDDPQCIYIFAVIALFIPLIGMIGMCSFNCGSGLGRRQKSAFCLLLLATFIGMVINGVFFYSR